MRSVWKWLGLAGAAGVVAGGVLVARDQRKRRAYTADEVRNRLHQRLAEYEGEAFSPGRDRPRAQRRTTDSCPKNPSARRRGRRRNGCPRFESASRTG